MCYTHTHTHTQNTHNIHVTTHCSLANTHHVLHTHTHTDWHTYKSDTGKYNIILQSHSHTYKKKKLYRAEHTKPLLEKSQILKQLHGLPKEQRTVYIYIYIYISKIACLCFQIIIGTAPYMALVVTMLVLGWTCPDPWRMNSTHNLICECD